tara:strand:+ start:140 stop:556 length:417 start_codon:yes stop_codon:yes gene_type:complete
MKFENDIVPSKNTWVQRLNFTEKLKKAYQIYRGLDLKILAYPALLLLLGYNNSGHFFTIELKVTKGNKLKFSPHQIAFHKRHPDNTFIMVKALGPLPLKTFSISMYRGTRITELVACGLKLEACYSGLDACRLALEAL